MQRAALALCLLAPTCAAMGTHVIQIRFSFFSDAIAHSVFTGVAIGLAVGLDPLFTMLAFTLAIGWAVVMMKASGRLPADTIIGVFMSASVALGLALVTISRRINAFTPYLFGDVLSVTIRELVVVAILSSAAIAFLVAYGNSLMLAALSQELAQAEEIPVRRLEVLFSLLLSALIAVSVRFVGALLVTALLLVPAAAARQVSRSVSGNFWTAIGVGLSSSMIGLYASYILDIGTGPSIILVAFALFLLCAVVGRVRRG